MMGTDVTKSWTSSPPCPHSEARGAPVCWDCAEGGHVRSPTVDSEGTSPTWQRFKKIRRSLGFRDAGYSRSNIYLAGTSVSTLEVVPPEEGLEVGSPFSRRSQPGLILVAGPRVVSPEDKFLKPELRSWDSESTQTSTQKDETVSESGTASELTRKEKIWGLQRRTFYILIAVAIITFAGVIIGIGVAVSQQNRAHSTSKSASGGGQPMTTIIVAPPPATTSSSPLPSASSTSSRICLGDDGSTYTDPGTGDKFRIECAVAHQGRDIENLEAETMQECISMCAKNKFCKGAIWFNVGPQGTDLNYCWLKSSMDGEVQDTRDAQSVVLL
ncbi:hypothetical protein F4801DRAFT_69335 [Xylaria longipes]|nr:hypothetical protein F4801DRAFT_69335 [Xylaria longipes]